MKIDGGISFVLSNAAETAREAEAAGYTGGFTAETSHDPFLPCAIAAEHTETLEIGTSIAVAFARSPMTVANTAWDLQAFSGGRFILGLGSQIKPHITKRFSMEWSNPGPRMREYVQALHAIWDTWQTGATLRFEGDFYKHTLMTPMFSPEPLAGTKPKVFLAAVGPYMTAVAGEVCDGWISHGFTTAAYLEDVSIPALREGVHKAGRQPHEVEISLPAFIVTGETEEEMARAGFATRKQIAFYGSTPAYRVTLDHHGLGDLQPKLREVTKSGDWSTLGDLIDDDVLDLLAVRGTPQECATRLTEEYGGLADRLSLTVSTASDEALAAMLDALG